MCEVRFMPYAKLLNKLIDESKMTIKDIATKCAVEYSVKVTPSYISLLKSGKANPPSDDLSKAIAKVCKVNEMLLVIEAYVDSAPDAIKQFINVSRNSIFEGIVLSFENQFPEEMYNAMKAEINKMELSQFILQMNDAIGDFDVTQLTNEAIYKVNDDVTDATITFKKPLGLEMKDDSMYPMLPKGSTVFLEFNETYNTGDILCIKQKNKNENFLIRKCFITDDSVMLFPINTAYETITVNQSDITILGRVSRYSCDIT